jgi:DNA polymerase
MTAFALQLPKGRPAEVVRLAHETDLDGWRAAARSLRARGIAPERVIWTVGGDGPSLAPAVEAAAFTVPKALLQLAAQAIRHRSDERFSRLYRLLWRLQDRPGLLHDTADPDVARVTAFARDVERAAHRMKAFMRFHEAQDAAGPVYVGWFEPAQRVTELAAAHFAECYPGRRFAILTPDVCAHWDGRALVFTAGIDPADAPGEAGLLDLWRARFARNPAAAGTIPPAMVRSVPSEPSRRVVKAAVRASRDAPYDGQAPTSLEEIAAGVDHCRRCDLWRDATQGVPGEGPAKAKLLFVGEQPGDQEDLAGRPFVGPAGQVFDRALAEAGVPRAETYVTNAVKHFKHVQRGKRRIHQTPNAGEVAACRWWLDAERRILRPRVVVALGATAIGSVFGKSMAVSKFRQQALQLPDQAQGVVTYHPSYLLRLPDRDAKAAAYKLFVEDLRFAWSLAEPRAH